MIKKSLNILLLCLLSHVCSAQEIGEIREVKLWLGDIPTSGGSIQVNFITADTSEIYSFNHVDWLDKHLSLYAFNQMYRDSCFQTHVSFFITMIYIPMEQVNHERYKGYIPTGEVKNQWVLTSVLRAKEDGE